MKQNRSTNSKRTANAVPVTKQKKPYRRAVRIIVAAILVFAVSVAGAVYYTNRDIEPFDYLNEDLSEYIYISPEDYTGYKNYMIEIAMDELTDDTVRTAINNLLFESRGKEPLADQGESNVLGVGDAVTLYFQAYYMNDDGTKGEAVNGMSNFTVKDDENREYNIGEGVLDKLGLNLELKLIGHDYLQYTSCSIETAKETQVRDGDIVFLTYTGTFSKEGSNPVQKSQTEFKINLADGREKVDAAWGEGFFDLLLGQKIGAENTQVNLSSFSTDEYDYIRYNSIKVDYLMRKNRTDKDVLEIKTSIPCTNSDSSLQGKSVIFELYINNAVKYDVPALDEAFIKDELKIEDEVLSAYEGDDIISRFEAYIKAVLEKRNEAEIKAIRIQGMWSHYYSIAQFKKLPENEIKRIVNSQKKLIEEAYDADDKGYETLDAYANAYIYSATGSSLVWTDYLQKQAESEVKERLIFYYVARAEKLLPDESLMPELEKKVIENKLAEYIYSYNIYKDNYGTEAEYNAAVAEYRTLAEEYYSDKEFLRYSAHLEYAEARMSELGNWKFRN